MVTGVLQTSWKHCAAINLLEKPTVGGSEQFRKLGYFLGGYVPPGTPNWHPILKKLSAKIDTPF